MAITKYGYVKSTAVKNGKTDVEYWQMNLSKGNKLKSMLEEDGYESIVIEPVHCQETLEQLSSGEIAPLISKQLL